MKTLGEYIDQYMKEEKTMTTKHLEDTLNTVIDNIIDGEDNNKTRAMLSVCCGALSSRGAKDYQTWANYRELHGIL